MVVVSKYELRRLKNLIHQKDPEAFVMVISPNIIWGDFEKHLMLNE
jgi:uncharacterized membrane-anchored protein YitT (DUF2179 family)